MEMSGNKRVIVRHVFAENLEREFSMINSVILRYPFVSMSTEFLRSIFKPKKQTVNKSNPITNYHHMKSKVDALKIIQLGLTLSDARGNLPDFNSGCCYVWEFNFEDIDIDRDRYSSDSIELRKPQGIHLANNKEKGIDSRDFAKMFLNSRMMFICCSLKGISWITFHGAYDFGFLLKILTQSPLPYDLQSFVSQLVNFLGFNVFDLKHTLRSSGMRGGLEKVAQTLNVARVVGSSHQAGPDSLLILHCFMKLNKSNVFECNQRSLKLPPIAFYGLV